MLLGLDLVRELHVACSVSLSLLDTASDVSVIDLVYNQASVLASSEEPVVVEGEPHPLDAFSMRLHCRYLVKVRFVLATAAISRQELPDLDCSWSAVLPNSCEECLAVVEDVDLRDHGLNIAGTLAISVADVVDLSVSSYQENLVLLVGDVAEACELHSLDVDVMRVVASAALFFHLDELVLVGVSVDSATREAHVVLVPVDASYLVDVPLALHVLRTLSSVEVEHVDRAQTHCTGEEVTTVTELDLPAKFELERVVGLDRGRQHIHELDVVANGNHDMEAARMESYSLGLVSAWDSVRDLQLPLCIVPHIDEPLAAGDNELLPEADVHASDLVHVEWRVDVLRLG